jgi:ABC-type lipoprotein release transport system permease subunit
MKLFLQLAWRNLWRNKRRTLISTSSVFFAVILSLAMRSMQNGSYDYMIQSAVGLYLGYIQVHGEGYWEKRSFDQSLAVSDSTLASFASVPRVTEVVPRLEAFALVSKDSATKVAQVIGIDPVRENAMTGLAKRVEHGEYLQPASQGVMLGEGIAKFLNAGIGDSIVIYGQGYHGVTAAARVPVMAILKFPIPDLDNSTSYLSLPYAQWLFSAPGRVTSVAFMIRSPGDMDNVRGALKEKTGPGTEVMTWKEMMPELVQAIQADSAGGVLMLLILYVVIGFGIFGTIMMMTTERTREFAVLISVGMKRWKLIAVTVVETIVVSMIWALAGVAAGIPLLWYFHLHPIPLTGEYAEVMLAYGLEPLLPFSNAPGIFLAQTAVVFGLAVVCAVYPFLVIRKLNPVAGLHT